MLEDETTFKDKGQTQVPFDSARSSLVAAADTKLTSLTQSGLTQQPDAALSCEKHAVPDDINIEPAPAIVLAPAGSLESLASATGLSLIRKQQAGSAGCDSSYASAGSAAACSTTRLHSAVADMALISSAASARHLQCKSAQQSVLFPPAVLPSRPAFSRGGRAAHLELFAVAPQALTTSQDKNADQAFPFWGGHQEAKMPMSKQDRLADDVSGMQAANKQHPSDKLPYQGLNGALNEATSSWDYIESSQQSKSFLGRRKSAIRQSLDIDFNTNEPLAVTRRSKDYGERTGQSDSRRSAKQFR